MKKHILFFCFLLSCSLVNKAIAQVNYQWAKGIGTSNGDIGTSIAVDAAGNVYTTGLLGFGTTNFNPYGTTSYPASSAGTGDCYRAKYDAAGNCLWAKSFGLSNGAGAIGLSIAVDMGGSVYISGSFGGTVDFGGTSLTGNVNGSDGFLAKYNSSDGSLAWVKQMSSSSTNSIVAKSLAVDYTGGQVYVTGTFEGVADFNPLGTPNTRTSAGLKDIFFADYDLSGNLQWVKGLGGIGEDISNSVATEAFGIYITGSFNDTVNFDPAGAAGDTISSKGVGDIFFAKYSSSLGTYMWAKSIGSHNEDQGTGIAVDAVHNIYITGTYKGTADFNPDTAMSADTKLSVTGACDAFFAKYDNNGTFQWANPIAAGNPADSVFASGIVVNPMNKVFLTGCLKGTADFNTQGGGNPFTSKGLEDIFFSEYDNAGVFVCTKNIGGLDEDLGYGIAVDSIGNVCITGSFKGTANFDPGAGTANRISNGGTKDIFIAKYANGNSSITGLVKASDGTVIASNLNNNSYVKLYTQVNNDGNQAMHLVDVIAIDFTGHYTFSNINVGNYIVLAEANSTDYPSVVPTYYSNDTSTHWQQAITITVASNAIDTANIIMKKTTSLAGSAILSGIVLEDDAINRTVTPSSSTPVVLEHDPAGIIVASITTDTTGYYEFHNVMPGDYTIYVNIPGLPMDSSYHVHVYSSDSIPHLDFVADSSSIDTVPRTITSVKQTALTKMQLEVYPNPHNGTAVIEFTMSEANKVQLDVYNLLGEKVVELLNDQKQVGVVKYRFNASNSGLPAGIYLLKLKVGENCYTKKIIQTE